MVPCSFASIDTGLNPLTTRLLIMMPLMNQSTTLTVLGKKQSQGLQIVVLGASD
jgi:hypothetical protein